MAQIKMHHSLVRAHKILKMVNSIGIPAEIAKKVWLESWDNCRPARREQGLVIAGMYGSDYEPFKIFFAECGNSDESVVVVDYHARGMDSSPSDHAWENHHHFFRFNDIKGPAAFIVRTLKNLFPTVP